MHLQRNSIKRDVVKMKNHKVAVFWFRRDLRLEDNHGLFQALHGEYPVLPIFIFDNDITDELPRNDARVTFIYNRLKHLSNQLKEKSTSLYCKQGTPLEVWKQITQEFSVQAVYTNEDYEPYAINRDMEVAKFLHSIHIPFHSFKDQVLFSKDEILKADGTPYTVFTPYKKQWLKAFASTDVPDYTVNIASNYFSIDTEFPKLSDLGFQYSDISVIDYQIQQLDNYEEVRDFPAKDQTSYLSPHLRFGTISIRRVIRQTHENAVFLSELIWREFFMQILYHFPNVVTANFHSKYNQIAWRNNEKEFELWKNGQTGYPMVDAGMRQLNSTGYMHNRVRMVVAAFLCKHLLIDWRWGEAYFAEKLLDFDLSANNGNWQWAAGTGCDAAPYFRVFNPTIQLQKFDPDFEYVRKWVPEFDSFQYPAPMVEHKMARLRAIETYKKGLALYQS